MQQPRYTTFTILDYKITRLIAELAAICQFAKDGVRLDDKFWHVGLLVSVETLQYEFGTIDLLWLFGPDADPDPAKVFAQVLDK